MDPLRLYVPVVDSFTYKYPPVDSNILPSSYSMEKIKLQSQIKTNEVLQPIYVDRNLYQEVMTPLIDVNSIFKSKDSIELANLDAIYNFSRHLNGFLDYQTRGAFTYVSMNHNGVEYLEWRRPDSFGYGLGVDKKIIDPTRFNNEINNLADLVDKVYGIEEGVLLALGSGLNMVDELNVALNIIYKEGDYITKLPDTTSNLAAQVIFLAANAFKSVTLIKPLSSSTTYLLCQGKREEVDDIIEILDQNLEATNLPLSFTRWLQNQNNLIYRYQRESNRKYNEHKFLILLNVPS